MHDGFESWNARLVVEALSWKTIYSHKDEYLDEKMGIKCALKKKTTKTDSEVRK